MTAYYFFRCSLRWVLCITNFLLINASYSSPSGISNPRGITGSDQVTHHMPTEANPQRLLHTHTISHQRHTKSNQTIMIIERRDPLTGKKNTMEISLTESQRERIEEGVECMQVIIPLHTADEREFLISGIMPESWAATFPPEQDDTLPVSEK